MAFTDIMRSRTRVRYRSGRVFVEEDTGTDPELHDLGILGELTIGVEPIAQDADTEGQETQLAVQLNGEMTLQQTSKDDFAGLAFLALEERKIFITDKAVDVSEVETEAEFRIVNAVLRHGGTLNYKGSEQSEIMLYFGGTISLESWVDFLDGTDTELVIGS